MSLSHLILNHKRLRFLHYLYFSVLRKNYVRFMLAVEPGQWRKQGVPYLSKQECYARIRKAIIEQQPFLATRLGGNEHAWLKWVLGEVPKYPATRVADLHDGAGVIPQDVDFYKKFIQYYGESFRDADILGIWHGKNEARTYRKLNMHAAVTGYSHITGCYTDFLDGTDRTGWFDAMKGKRVLAISSHAPLIIEQASEEKWNRYWAGRLDWFHPQSVQAIRFPHASEPEVEAQYGDSFRLISAFQEEHREAILQSDVILAGCGAYAAPLLAWTKSLGKPSIFMGGDMQVLFGIAGGRWRNRKDKLAGLINEHWVDTPASMRPSIANKVEGSAYW